MLTYQHNFTDGFTEKYHTHLTMKMFKYGQIFFEISFPYESLNISKLDWKEIKECK